MEMTCSFRRGASLSRSLGQSGHPVSHIQGLVQPLHPYACPVTQWTSNRSPAAFSEIREYFKLRGEIFSLLLLLKSGFCNSETLSNGKSPTSARFFTAQPKYMKRPDLVAGAPRYFEPGTDSADLITPFLPTGEKSRSCRINILAGSFPTGRAYQRCLIDQSPNLKTWPHRISASSGVLALFTHRSKHDQQQKRFSPFSPRPPTTYLRTVAAPRR